ncbi:MAG: hypothetical protein AAGE18_14915 [Pseudomonadota bacterium]
MRALLRRVLLVMLTWGAAAGAWSLWDQQGAVRRWLRDTALGGPLVSYWEYRFLALACLLFLALSIVQRIARHLERKDG